VLYSSATAAKVNVNICVIWQSLGNISSWLEFHGSAVCYLSKIANY